MVSANYLEQVGEECKSELDGIGIRCGDISRYKSKDNIKEWGMCICVGDNKYFILINSILLNPKFRNGLKIIMIHELLHTLPDCIKHTHKWMSNAQLVKQRLGYNIKKTSNYDELGISSDEYIKAMNYKYIAQCLSCGKIFGYKRKVDVIIRPYRYRCNICGGTIYIKEKK